MPTVNPLFSGTITQTTVSMVSQEIAGASESWVALTLNVIDVQGENASAVFRIQWSLDGAVWAEGEPRDEFDPITAPVAVCKRFETKGKYWRAAVEVSGTNPSFTGSANVYS